MKYLFVTCFLQAFFLFSFISNSFAHCYAFDDCLPKNPCLKKKNYFGAASDEAIKFDFDYYDAILVVSPLSKEELAAKGLMQEAGKGKDHIFYKRVQEVLKDDISFSNTDTGIIDYKRREIEPKLVTSKGKHEWKLPKIQKLLKTGEIVEQEVCFSKYHGHKNNTLMYFKKYPDQRKPTLVRATSIDDNTYKPESEIAQNADFVFTALAKHVEYKINKRMSIEGEWPSHSVDDYQIRKVWKGDTQLEGQNVRIKTRKFLESNVVNKLIKSSTQQRLVYFLKRNPKHTGYYNIIHVMEDVEWELEQLRKIKSQE